MNFPTKKIFRIIFSKFVLSKRIHDKPIEIKESASNLPKDFNETNYLILNPDVKSQGLDPREHYLHFGYAESRPYKFGEFLKGKQIFHKNKKTCLVVVHDFALTGSPLLALAVTKKLNTHLNVVILSLVKEGKLKDLFVENSSAVFCVSALFDDYQVSEGIIKTLNDEFEFDFSIVNSASANNILFGLSKYNIPTVTLIHEFAQTTESKKVSKCLELSDVCVFSTKSTLDAGLKELGHEPNSKIFVQTQGKITHSEVLGDLNFVTTSETSFE